MSHEQGSPPPPAPRTVVVGVVNITEDSFSDGGRYLATDHAIAHALRLRADGADVVELGAAASHPDAKAVPPREEWRRLRPVLDALRVEGVPVSVDSFHLETLRRAARHGVTMLNDIQGFPDARLYPALAERSCRLVVMHSVQGRGPATRVRTDPETVWTGACRFFEERLASLRAAGVDRGRIVIDPGLGYFLGRDPEPSLLALARIGRLRSRFEVPVLVSASRKSFLRALTGRTVADSGAATLAAELFAVAAGADYIRTHDVAALRDGLLVRAALAGRAGS